MIWALEKFITAAFFAVLLVSNAFAQKTARKAEIVTPEFFELVKIAFALTDFAKEHPYLIKKNTEYYRRVQAYFEPVKNHQIIEQLNENLKKDFSTYIVIRGYSINFVFENDKIKKIDLAPRAKVNADYFRNAFQDLSVWEDFARQSNFRKFYADNQEFYQHMQTEVRKNLPIEDIWSWLEREFPEKYDVYTVVVSPLIGGTHSTFRNRENGVNRCFMFVSSANLGEAAAKRFTAKQIEGIYTGVVFTEIDHNYNNPVSVKFEKKLEKAMPDERKWSNGLEAKTGLYKTARKIFDEYATHSLYLLYIHDRFSSADYEVIKEARVNLMVKLRGFEKFREFHEEFLRLYQNRKAGEKISDLYPKIIEWIAHQSQNE